MPQSCVKLLQHVEKHDHLIQLSDHYLVVWASIFVEYAYSKDYIISEMKTKKRRNDFSPF